MKMDMAKVTQALDNGWQISLVKNQLATYSAEATHHNGRLIDKLREVFTDEHFDGEWLITDDFSPEAALTRLAYKIHGDILEPEHSQ